MVKKKPDQGVTELEAKTERQRLLTGEEINRRRRRAHMSRSALAKRIGATMQHIGALETGAEEPGLSELSRIAAELRCSVSDLLPPLTKDGRAFGELFEAASETTKDVVSSILRFVASAPKKRGGARP